jgi:hypothetical protein
VVVECGLVEQVERLVESLAGQGALLGVGADDPGDAPGTMSTVKRLAGSSVHAGWG